MKWEKKTGGLQVEIRKTWDQWLEKEHWIIFKNEKNWGTTVTIRRTGDEKLVGEKVQKNWGVRINDKNEKN